MVDFGNRLRELRLRYNFTQQQLANKLNVTKSVISYYELQERSPSPDILIKLSLIFNVTTDYLLGIEKTHTLDISDLDEESIKLLEHTAAVLRKKSK